jgi:pyrroloquinoline quinone (PQQ) biosynthesis protein C
MRTVGAYGPLAAALCSGLLEYTAGDRAAVSGWHALLSEQGLLPEESVTAIFEHVQTDLGLGHGSNWRDAIRAAKVVPVQDLADYLNAITLVAEMIVRWVEGFETGLSAATVSAAPLLALRGAERVYGGEADGLPVWPAEIYASYAHGPRSSAPGVRNSLALAYAFSGTVTDGSEETDQTPATVAAAMTRRIARDWDGARDEAGLEKLVESWMTAIDGHELWRVLAEEPTMPLVHGWLIENYHYVAGIWQHCGAAISTCPDPLIRGDLVKHLTEEFHHGRMFLRGINRAYRGRDHGLTPDLMRPLPTTVAFIGTLREIGERDWKAYLLALAFLQLTLKTAGGSVHTRHEGFYSALQRNLPESEAILAPMRSHDAEDTKLGHGDDTRDLLAHLASRHELTAESVRAAALIPQLTWSFLDGIRQHYRHGEAAVLQRMGWHVNG